MTVEISDFSMGHLSPNTEFNESPKEDILPFESDNSLQNKSFTLEQEDSESNSCEKNSYIADTEQISESIKTSQQGPEPEASNSKNVYKKKKEKDADDGYFLFGYVPNYTIPIIGIQMSYPIDVIGRYTKLGFKEGGITKKSFASILQGFIYGGQIPKDSIFAYVQSFSTKK
ncbi:3343_t:CDS:2 [Funneliformis mosseae]|uniref:3343_t:CDS:1 n=2 Tax=Funneliformis TaxID=1117308 RepID=A0A9N8ZFF1_FUNMO|nr:3343_t:CDS:2 [Funneliformis mosseae]